MLYLFQGAPGSLGTMLGMDDDSRSWSVCGRAGSYSDSFFSQALGLGTYTLAGSDFSFSESEARSAWNDLRGAGGTASRPARAHPKHSPRRRTPCTLQGEPPGVARPPDRHARIAMKITLLSEESIRLEADAGPMTIEALSADQLYSPFHMLASGLAFCTFSILHSWAETVKLSADDLAVEVGWTFADDPHRVGALVLSLDWPSLPEARRRTAERVAALCAIHGTLTHPPEITIGFGGTNSAARGEPSATAEPAAAGDVA